MGIPHFVYSLITWWTLDCFYFLVILSNSAMNICVPEFTFNLTYFNHGEEK